MERTQHPDRHSRRPALLAGVLAAAMGAAAAELTAGLLPGGESLFVAVGDRVIGLAPGTVVAVAIALLGTANRIVLVAAMVVGLAVIGGLVGRLAVGRPRAAALAVATVAALGVLAGVVDPLVPAVTGVAAPIAGALAAGATLWALLRAAPASSRTARDPLDGGVGSRRAFLRLALGAAGGAAALAVAGGVLQQRASWDAARAGTSLPRLRTRLPPPPPEASFDVNGLSPLITPNDRFYRIDTALRVPRIDPDDHVVRVTGMVDRPVEVSYRELLGLADTEADVHLACVSNEIGGDLVGNARWTGVPLAQMLERAGVRDDATQVVGRAVDGWTGGFPVETVFDGRPALVAVGMNGEPLPADHGFPVRLVIAGLYGYVSDTKWLAEIELTTFEAYDAYWINRGWARHGPIKTQSRIDVPRRGAEVVAGPVAVAGVAWAGERGISRVEVAVDDDWRDAELAAELATTSWRQWKLRWDAEPGEHVLKVRATDGTGETQTAQYSPPRPDGATGHHSIRVTVALSP